MRLRAASLLAVAAACATPAARVQRLHQLGDEEQYAAVLKERSTSLLRDMLQSTEPMTRNAAARALCDLGDKGAAEALIFNLGRDSRTFVATDAIHHLRELFGEDKGYDPNLGYRHQTEKQREWWLWFGTQSFGELRTGRVEEEVPLAELPPRRWTHDEILEAWEKLAAEAKSRRLEDVRRRRLSFAQWVEAWPEHPDLWNNYALAALNDGAWEESERAYRHALKLRPTDASLHNDVGILLEGLGRLPEAEEHYREAARLAPESDVAFTNLADVLAKQGRIEDAIATYQAAERLAPEKWYYHRLWIGRLKQVER